VQGTFNTEKQSPLLPKMLAAAGHAGKLWKFVQKRVKPNQWRGQYVSGVQRGYPMLGKVVWEQGTARGEIWG